MLSMSAGMLTIHLTSGAFGAGKLTSARVMCAVRAGLHLAGNAAGNLRKGQERMLFPSKGEKTVEVSTPATDVFHT